MTALRKLKFHEQCVNSQQVTELRHTNPHKKWYVV